MTRHRLSSELDHNAEYCTLSKFLLIQGVMMDNHDHQDAPKYGINHNKNKRPVFISST